MDRNPIASNRIPSNEILAFTSIPIMKMQAK